MKTMNLFKVVAYLLTLLLFTQCTKEDELMEGEKGQFNIEITDAPSDDANIQGTFVTISELKIDGKSVEGFTKQTIEISSFQKGNTRLILNKELEAKTYNTLTLILDYESDAAGNTPGCYVQTKDNTKHNLNSSGETKGEFTFTKKFEVKTASQLTMVIDFDLRKSIVYTNNSVQNQYKFVTSAEMKNSFRFVEKESCGEVKGKVNSTISSEGQMYIFIYKKGEFNSTTESQGQGNSNILFVNAVTSAKVESDGSYTLAFLEEGDYEVHLASYNKGSDNKFMFKNMLNASSAITGILLNKISVSAESQIQLNIEILGLL